MKKIFLTLILGVCSLSLWAVPAKRQTIRVGQPDGTELILTPCGDEYFHYLMTDDGIMVKHSGCTCFSKCLPSASGPPLNVADL